MIERPLVSIVVPTYNQSRYLPITLDHVLNQDYEKMEIIIVNDCSSDETEKIIEKYLSSLKTEQVSRMDRYENKGRDGEFSSKLRPEIASKQGYKGIEK